MRRGVGLLYGALLMIGCEDADGPTGASGPELDFDLTASSEVIDSKSRVEIVVRITRAVGVEFPLTVRFEKQNVGDAFIQEGLFVLRSDSETTATISPPLRQDPKIRATVTESSSRAISVSKTISIDVVDFP